MFILSYYAILLMLLYLNKTCRNLKIKLIVKLGHIMFKMLKRNDFLEGTVHQLNCSYKDAVISQQVDCNTFTSFFFPLDVK